MEPRASRRGHWHVSEGSRSSKRLGQRDVANNRAGLAGLPRRRPRPSRLGSRTDLSTRKHRCELPRPSVWGTRGPWVRSQRKGPHNLLNASRNSRDAATDSLSQDLLRPPAHQDDENSGRDPSGPAVAFMAPRRLRVILDRRPMLTVREVASALHLSTATVYHLLERGELVHRRISNAIRVSLSLTWSPSGRRCSPRCAPPARARPRGAGRCPDGADGRVVEQPGAHRFHLPLRVVVRRATPASWVGRPRFGPVVQPCACRTQKPAHPFSTST